ncbi:ferredoxin [Frankia sp. Mgl5]|uniref:Ferredoxin n=1 Tax=Parafrankia soli TaxID=2599596 RepID=A0A1S1Q738_9ACTN|nr:MULTISPECIES: ferredoxin [Frankiaceae]ABW13326.1 ferredoxin 1 [Frankia sp. EAN1pec]CAI7977115.1 Ferredoxin [Frankia sp. Hr75.2]MCK9926357.1 ferredoxin [Frankia sp. Mgl5]OHV28932.1 ferredoxin [Parafrankia soli]TCJ31926.1 ferredoxin [Parafrankia sp. BMG5.11]
MKVTVDADGCCGHSTCCTLCPEVFTLSDDGYAVVEVDEVPAEFEKAVREAVANCPERAITAS